MRPSRTRCWRNARVCSAIVSPAQLSVSASVNTVSEFRCIRCVSHGNTEGACSIIRCLASLRRVRQGAVPRVRRYYQDTMTSCRPSRVTSSPSFGDTTVCTRAFALAQPNATTQAWSWCPVSPSGMFPWKRQDLPSSSRDPNCPFAHARATPARRPLQTRRRSSASLFSEQPHGPRDGHAQGSRKNKTFEAQSHGFQTRCLRFVTSRYLAQRKTRFRPLVKRSLDGLPTRRVTTRGFKFTSCQLSSSAKLLGAIPVDFPA